MNPQRRKRGDETWNRLLNWTEAQKASERLAGHIVAAEGFRSIDPSHPLGGSDGLRDLICSGGGIRWVVAAYFPNGKRPFSEIKVKFEGDARGAIKNNVQGFVFVTNQDLKISERETLTESAPVDHVEIYHLERIARILDSPVNYGIRLEFLDIEMTKEEQLAFFGTVTSAFETITHAVGEWQKRINTEVNRALDKLGDASISANIPTDELARFKGMLESIVGSSDSLVDRTGLVSPPPIYRLRVPLEELKEFAETLYGLASQPSLYYTSHSIMQSPPPLHQLHVPLEELKEFAEILYRLTSQPSLYSTSHSIVQSPPSLHQLHVPLEELREYEETVDRILSKLKKIRELKE